jgi:hypothetical protein
VLVAVAVAVMTSSPSRSSVEGAVFLATPLLPVLLRGVCPYAASRTPLLVNHRRNVRPPNWSRVTPPGRSIKSGSLPGRFSKKLCSKVNSLKAPPLDLLKVVLISADGCN